MAPCLKGGVIMQRNCEAIQMQCTENLTNVLICESHAVMNMQISSLLGIPRRLTPVIKWEINASQLITCMHCKSTCSIL